MESVRVEDWSSASCYLVLEVYNQLQPLLELPDDLDQHVGPALVILRKIRKGLRYLGGISNGQVSTPESERSE